MWLEKIRLSCFRSYQTREFSFYPEVNCIQGPNASGKSNLLEAIYLLSTGKSFRNFKLHDLIHKGSSQFKIEAFFHKSEISHQIEFNLNSENKQIIYDHTCYSSFLPLMGMLPSVLLTPEDISFISGGPLERRRFLDLQLSQGDPEYLFHLKRYHQALKQRNFLLKIQSSNDLPIWEQVMSISAKMIIQKRIEMLNFLRPHIEQTISKLSGCSEEFSWHYVASSLDFEATWASSRKKDLLFKTTLTGPHRDDIKLFLNNQEMKHFSSEGQKRSVIAAIKIAEHKRLALQTSTIPLFGIDDFGVHLDHTRSEKLFEIILSLGQVFLTAPTFKNKNLILNIE